MPDLTGILKQKVQKRKKKSLSDGVGGALNRFQSMVTARGVGTTLNGVARERRFGTYQSPGGM